MDSVPDDDNDGDVLRSITFAELDQLMQLYRRHRPRADVAYMFVLQQRRLFALFGDATRHPKVPDRIRFSIYTPKGGRFDENGTLVAFSAGLRFLLYTFTLEDKQTELRESLERTQRIHWNRGVSVIALSECQMSVVEEHLHNIDPMYAERIVRYRCNVLTMSAARAHQFEYVVPAGFTVKSLDANENAALINAVWPHRDSDSEGFVRGLIEYHGGFGLYPRNSKQPVSWAVVNEFQGLGMLQTLEGERRKGYGCLMVQAFCRLVASRHGDDIVAFVIGTNRASNSLLQSLGFVVTDQCVYLDYMID